MRLWDGSWARRKNLAQPSKAVLGQNGCGALLPQIPSAGLWACATRASSFNAAGVGSFGLATGRTGVDHLGDRAKHPAVKSSTMKGPTG